MKLISKKVREVKIDDAVFKIRRLDAQERAEVAEVSMMIEATATRGAERGKISVNPIRYQLAVVERGLVGWENIFDDEGNPVPFDKDKIKLLPEDVLDKLAGEIAGTAGLTAEEAEELRG